MVFEHGSEQTMAALRLLESQKDHLNCPDLKIVPLGDPANRAVLRAPYL